MFEDVQRVDLTRQDVELIEAALATQEKILSVQARAGGRSARAKLNDLKALMRRLRRQVPEEQAPASGEGWQRFTRLMF